MSPFSTVSIGIIGLGNIGRFHADRLVEHGVDLVGGMDVDPEARERFGTTYGVETYADAEALYDDCDAIVVATPNAFHEEYTVGALEAGLDVLVEKPIAHPLESAEHVAEVAQESEGFCMVGFKNRFANAVEVIKEFQRRGRFGQVRHIEANYVRRRGIPGRGSWFTSGDVSGGGSLLDLGVHAIDLALHFLDFPEVVEVTGTTRSEFGSREDYAFIEMWGEDTGPEGFDVDDSASAFIRCADGSTVNLEVAWATNRSANEEFLIHGTEAGARFDRNDKDLTIYESSKAGVDHLADTDITTSPNDPLVSEQEAFLRGVVSDDPPRRCTVEQGLTVQRVIDAIYRSSDEGRAIPLDDSIEASTTLD